MVIPCQKYILFPLKVSAGWCSTFIHSEVLPWVSTWSMECLYFSCFYTSWKWVCYCGVCVSVCHSVRVCLPLSLPHTHAHRYVGVSTLSLDTHIRLYFWKWNPQICTASWEFTFQKGVFIFYYICYICLCVFVCVHMCSGAVPYMWTYIG